MSSAIKREWPDETAFIIAGGPSLLTQPYESLKGRRVIAVNSSYQAVPWADVLFFGDDRWWEDHYRRPALHAFAGRIITVARQACDKRILRLRASPPPGLSADHGALTFRRTSLTAAINVAVHLGVASIVLLGVDGKPAEDGRTHHHEPHRWMQRPNCWDEQKKDVVTIVGPLSRKCLCINASPGSAWGDLWPVMTLTEAIDVTDRHAAEKRETVVQYARHVGGRRQSVPTGYPA